MLSRTIKTLFSFQYRILLEVKTEFQGLIKRRFSVMAPINLTQLFVFSISCQKVRDGLGSEEKWPKYGAFNGRWLCSTKRFAFRMH